jgi:hypothetical protein
MTPPGVDHTPSSLWRTEKQSFAVAHDPGDGRHEETPWAYLRAQITDVCGHCHFTLRRFAIDNSVNNVRVSFAGGRALARVGSRAVAFYLT